MDGERLAEDGITLTEIDGVPVVWADGMGDPTAVLTFRVGQADETLLTRGYTHLAEHVALAEFAHATFPVNGSTGLSITQFFAATQPERLASFVSTVTTRIGQLASSPRDELLAEIRHDAKVLRAEHQSRSRSVVAEVLTDLYGIDTLGLAAYDELGLVDLDIGTFSGWVRNRFTRENAVLMLTCAPPSGLSLASLPSGGRQPAVSLAPLASSLPGHRRRNGPLAVVGPVGRSPAAVAMATLFERALVRRLRHESGSSYAPSVLYDPISNDEALVSAVADCGPGQGTLVTNGALAELERLAHQGPTPDELTTYRELVDHSHTSESSRRSHLGYVASALLYGGELRTLAETRDLVDSVSSDDVRAAAASLAASMAVSIPADAELIHDIPPFHEWSTDPPLDGPRVHTRAIPNSSQGADLVLADDGLSLIDGERKVNIRSHDVVALLQWDDGFEELVGRAALTFRLVPGRWNDEDRIREHLRQLAGDRTRRMGMRFAAPPSDPPTRIRVRPSSVWLAVAAIAALTVMAALSQNDPVPWIVATVVGVVAAIAYTAHVARALDSTQVYDDLEWHVNDPNWRSDLPLSRAYAPGAMKLAWLADNGLLEEWVERGAAEHLASYRAGELDAIGLHRELGGVLASDMCVPEASRFFNWLSFARIDGKVLFDRWWGEVWPRTGPYELDLSPAILGRSSAWFDKAARRYRLELPLAANRLTNARRPAEWRRGAPKGAPSTVEHSD